MKPNRPTDCKSVIAGQGQWQSLSGGLATMQTLMQRATSLRSRGFCRRARRGNAGFTLIELLVVITIIGILASMTTVAVFAAIRQAREADIRQECTKIDLSFQSFREKFTALPPDGSGGQQKAQQFVQKAFPRAKSGTLPPSEVTQPTTGPARSVVFWLREVSNDAREPFQQAGGNVGGGQNEGDCTFFTFSDARLRGGMYYPKGYEPGVDPPFLYFNSETYGIASYLGPDGKPFKPYDHGQPQNQQGGNNKSYAASESCQIITAGLDKRLGVGGTLLLDSVTAGSGQVISQDDEDNLVNFSQQRIGDIRE
jgi:prepilin-type N-terminal cleavage/methylation domain-containing protein